MPSYLHASLQIMSCAGPRKVECRKKVFLRFLDCHVSAKNTRLWCFCVIFIYYIAICVFLDIVKVMKSSLTVFSRHFDRIVMRLEEQKTTYLEIQGSRLRWEFWENPSIVNAMSNAAKIMQLVTSSEWSHNKVYRMLLTVIKIYTKSPVSIVLAFSSSEQIKRW